MIPSSCYKPVVALLALASLFVPSASGACTDNDTSTDGLQKLLTDGGAGYKLQLCQSKVYSVQDALNYTAANQEISTEGYPQDETRATLLMTGFNKTTLVQAINEGLNGVKLLNVQLNGNRLESEDIYKGGGGNIEFGGSNQNQVVEYVRTFDPRGWSCLHIAEGAFSCANLTIQNNDIGPCGRDYFQNNNIITDATDGGIVIFGSPNSTIRNNTIRARTRTMLGGINMVDVVPWLPEGNFSETLVDGNTIHGGFATSMGNATRGPNNASAIIKMGIAVGPDVWFSDGRYGTNQSTGATIKNNVFSGAFAFGMGVSSAKDFVIQNNSFTGNTSFIGSYGPNCTTSTKTPHPPVPLLLEPSSVTNLTLSNAADYVNGTALGLTCFMPPSADSNSWPYGDGFNAGPSSTGDGTSGTQGAPSQPASTGTGTGTDSGATATQSLPPPVVLGLSAVAGIVIGTMSVL